MLTALLLSLCLDSHQYTPLSGDISRLMVQVEDTCPPHPESHLGSCNLETHGPPQSPNVYSGGQVSTCAPRAGKHLRRDALTRLWCISTPSIHQNLHS